MRPADVHKMHIRRTTLSTLAGAAGLLLAGLLVAVVLPVVQNETQTDPSKARKMSGDARAGMSIYQREGCVYCHTQQVRPVSNDLGLGTVTSADQISKDGPNLLGLVRTGPDLSCYGSRPGGGAAGDALTAYLADPRSVFPASKMPRFGHLEEGELEDLSSYLMSLRCGGEL